MVLLEAAAGALPIVATAVGGNSEVVEDGRTGLVVPPRDPSALGAAMLGVMELSEGERHAMGQRGRERVRSRFALSRVVDTWEGLYRDLLADRGVPVRPAAGAATPASRAGRVPPGGH